MNIHLLTWLYFNDIADQIKEKVGAKEVSVDDIFEWIKHWGNGGGMLSVQMIFEDILKDNPNINYADFIDKIADDSSCESGTCVLFADILKDMISEIEKVKIYIRKEIPSQILD